MKYLDPSFSIHPGMNKKYRDNWDEIFGKKKKAAANKNKPEKIKQKKPKKKEE